MSSRTLTRAWRTLARRRWSPFVPSWRRCAPSAMPSPQSVVRLVPLSPVPTLRTSTWRQYAVCAATCSRRAAFRAGQVQHRLQVPLEEERGKDRGGRRAGTPQRGCSAGWIEIGASGQWDCAGSTTPLAHFVAPTARVLRHWHSHDTRAQLARRSGWRAADQHSLALSGPQPPVRSVCVCVCPCARTCVRACVRA